MAYTRLVDTLRPDRRLYQSAAGTAAIRLVEATALIFYLGTPEPAWLARTDVPLFVSARRLRKRKTSPRALGPFALDSGGFTELSQYGQWATSAMAYSAEARRWRDQIGNMVWCSPQDRMCEPAVLAKTKLTVIEHQRQTVANYLLLRQLAPDLPWIPVLQGWHLADYLRCVEMYNDRGVDLKTLPLVGLGSVCRRQDTAEAEELIAALYEQGLKLHAYGFKVGGLERSADKLVSADSMAWSKGMRGKPALPGCKHARCTWCMRYALLWRERVLQAIERSHERHVAS